MGGFIRTVLIVLAVLVIGAGAGYFLLPSKASKADTFTVERPANVVFGYLANTPPGAEIASGITQKAVTSAENNKVVAQIAFADGTEGLATYVVTPAGDNKSTVAVTLERPVGPNPIERVQALTGGEVAPLVEAAATSVQAGLDGLPKANPSNLAYEIVQLEAKPFVYADGCSPIAPAEIKSAVAQSLVAVRAVIDRLGAKPVGSPIAVETSWDEKKPDGYCFQIGYAVETMPAQRVYGGPKKGETPAGAAIKVHYKGAEENIIPTYDQMEALVLSARLELGKSMEVYLDDATGDAGSADREIYYLVTGDTSALARIAPPAQPAAAAPAAAPAPEAAPAEAAPAAPAAPAP